MVLLGPSDMLAYLSMMAPRLMELRRVLKSTGSIYLHCDPAASHYLKTLMDAVFSPERFVAEIVWRRHNARSTEQRWPHVHDVILMYSKEASFKFRSLQVAADKAKLPHTLITGSDGLRYQTYELTGAGVTKEGQSGKPWRGFDPSSMGRHWANAPKLMDEWDSQGLIHWPKAGTAGGFPRRLAAEPFDESQRRVTVGDVWTDIDRLNQTAKERLGYPTQKPLALLERIITASSDEGDIVLDPFCGCGTTVDAAQKLDRHWVGIDITHLAVNLIRHRLRDTYGPSVEKTYDVIGEPTSIEDAQQLAHDDPYQFQWWALGLVGARPVEQKKGADRGIDGTLFFLDEGKPKRVIISVKAGKTGAAHVRDLRGVIERDEASIGVLISLQLPTAEMRKEAASAGFYRPSTLEAKDYPRMQLLAVADLLSGKDISYPISKRVTFKKAPKASGAYETESLLPPEASS